MFFNSKKSNNRSTTHSEFMRETQAITNEAGSTYEGTLNFMAKDLNHFQYRSGTFDLNAGCYYLDYSAADSMIEDEVRILEQMLRVMVKKVAIRVYLLNDTMIRLEVRA